MPRSPFHIFATSSAATILYVFVIFPVDFENMFIQSLIWLSYYYLVKSANYEAIQSAVLPLLLLLLFLKL